MSRHYYCVWFADYPDEGSELALAENAREARQKAAAWFSAPASRLTAERATREIILERAKRGGR